MAKVAIETYNPVMLMDYNGNIMWINKAFTKFYGFSLKQLIAEKGKSVFGRNTDPKVKVAFGKSIIHKETVYFEKEDTARDGRKVWLISTITPIIENNKVVQLIIIDTDITKLKKAEEKILIQNIEIKAKNTEIQSQLDEIQTQNEEIKSQLEEIELINKELNKLSIVAEKTENAILMFDKSGNITWLNKAFERLQGYTLKELIKERWKNIISASENPDIESIIKKCFESKVSVHYSLENTTKSGKKYGCKPL